MLPNCIALFERFQAQNRDYVVNLWCTTQNSSDLDSGRRPKLKSDEFLSCTPMVIELRGLPFDTFSRTAINLRERYPRKSAARRSHRARLAHAHQASPAVQAGSPKGQYSSAHLRFLRGQGCTYAIWRNPPAAIRAARAFARVCEPAGSLRWSQAFVGSRFSSSTRLIAAASISDFIRWSSFSCWRIDSTTDVPNSPAAAHAVEVRVMLLAGDCSRRNARHHLLLALVQHGGPLRHGSNDGRVCGIA